MPQVPKERKMKGTDQDIRHLASRLIAEIAVQMIADGARPAEVVYARRDILNTLTVYVPDLFRRTAA
jgi:hypothetical protein